MTVERIQTTKTFSLGIEDIFAEWYWSGHCWSRLTQEVRDSEWYSEEYEHPVITTANILDCWWMQLPGNKDYSDYGDFFATFDMDEALDEDLSEDALVQILEHMADAVNLRTKITASTPWRATGRDAWGREHTYWRCPAVNPVEGMPIVDYLPDINH
jgi:hypothetical protein